MNNISIKPANEYKEELEKYHEINSEEYDTYYGNIDFDNLDNIIAYLENDEVIGYGYVDLYEPYKIISSEFSDYNKKIQVYKILSEDENVFINDPWVDLEELELFACDMSTKTFTELDLGERNYEPYYYESLFATRKENISALKDLFEKRLLEDSKEEITFEHFTLNGLENYIHRLNEKDNIFGAGYWKSKYGHYPFAGFHYFKPEKFAADNIEYLIAKQGDKMVGAIKYGFYNTSISMPHNGINYIDVQVGFRNKGIAKQMIKELDKYLNKKYPLFLTDASGMGSECKMEEYFKKYISGTDVVAYYEQEKYYKKKEIEKQPLDKLLERKSFREINDIYKELDINKDR